MRTFKKYAEGDHSESEQAKNVFKHTKRESSIKKVLRECQQIICDLQTSHDKLETSVKEKNTIINKLIEQKQGHMLHMANCNSQLLQQKIDEAQQKNLQMGTKFKEMTQRYERILQKNQTQLDKFKSYNRALRVDNAHLREQQEKTEQKKRKTGTISYSCNKQNSSFELTQINTNNQEQIRERSFEMIYQTPENLKSLKSTMLPSTQNTGNFERTEEKQWRSKELPRNLFQNHMIQKAQISKASDQISTQNLRWPQSSRKMQISRVIARVHQILDENEDFDSD